MNAWMIVEEGLGRRARNRRSVEIIVRVRAKQRSPRDGVGLPRRPSEAEARKRRLLARSDDCRSSRTPGFSASAIVW